MGALIQINYSSIKSHYETTKTLLERNMVHIIATDAHQSEWRNPYIVDYKEKILGLIGQDKFDKLARLNPGLVISDKYIDSEYDNVVKKEKEEKRSIFNFWRRK